MTRFRIVPERSRVWIEARSSIHPIHSATDGLEGFVELEFDGTDLVVPDPSVAGRLSLAVDRLSSGNGLEDREMQRRIEARRYPTVTGELTAIEPGSGDHRYRVSGDVTFRGVQRRCQDEMTIERQDEATIALAGSSHFDIRDYGMEPPRILMLKVEPDVDVRVEIIATKES